MNIMSRPTRAALRDIPVESAVALMDALAGRPNPEDPEQGPPPRPWWRLAFDLSLVLPADRIGAVALNPQPLPPAWAQLADVLVQRALALSDHALVGGDREAAGRFVLQMVDDICPPPRKFPFPPVPPGGGDPEPGPDWVEISDAGLMLLGARLRQAAAIVADEALAGALTEGGARAIGAGLKGLSQA